MNTEQTIFRVQKDKDNPFVMMDRRVLENPILSWKAKGLLAYLLSRPDNWEINIDHLIKQSTDGEHATRAAVKELIDVFHIDRTENRDDSKRFTKFVYTVYERPDQNQKYKPFPENHQMAMEPLRGFPKVGNPNLENRHINNKDITNKNICAGAQTPLDSRTAGCSIEVKDFPSFSISEDLPDRIEVPAKCITTPEKKGDMMDGFLAYSRQASDPAHALQARIAEYPADVQNTLKILVDLYGWTAGSIPVRPKGRESGKYGQWIHEIREIDLIIAGYGKTALEASVGPCAKLSISHPGAITWCLPGEVGKLAKIKARPSAIVDTPLTRHLETFTPRTPTPRPEFLLPRQ